jgi:hypothetical protein
MAQCGGREISQVNNLHLGRDLSRVSDFVLQKYSFGLSFVQGVYNDNDVKVFIFAGQFRLMVK